MSDQNSPEKIQTFPTKDFFITMLIRDVTLKDTIGDLVDNSVDGARSISNDDDYSGLKIEITATGEKFSIVDNCGGIEVKTAREYAFRIGRPVGFDGIKGSIGQFGIGMKRALFKMGKSFSINTIAETSQFELEVDVDEWAKEKGWDFEFKSFLEDQTNPKDSRSTEIVINRLKSDVISDFNNQNFISELKTELELENLYPISKGLSITINGLALQKRSLQLLSSDQIKPAYFEYESPENVKVKIIAGIGEPILDEGGWYIFCNGRLVLGPEQTELTGWTGGRGGDGGPKYHGQFQMFRGYVFFEADNASLLPWNTTKNGVDLDSTLYKAIKQRMIEVMKPIITFLNKMKEERENDAAPEDLFLKKQVEKTQQIEVSEITKDNVNIAKYTETVFLYDSPPIRRDSPNKVTIKYTKSKEEVEKVRAALKVKNPREVGERTFDYFLDMEVD